jgi:hypothetical protein
METATLTLASHTRPQTSWIVSKRTDLFWFTVGGAAASYLLWALWRYAHAPLLLLVAILAIVFDETHGFATISRTYFDAEERALDTLLNHERVHGAHGAIHAIVLKVL